jgi:CheY-like chemotaxis protein
VDVRLERDGSHQRIKVTDSGQGIPQDFIPFVFDRFSQADSSPTKRVQGGLGLGLSIVRHLVEIHGGSVEVTSPGINQGSTFTITLPIASMTDIDSHVSRPSGDGQVITRHDLKGARILAVDDDADARDLLLHLLTSHGAEVRIASSASAARRQLQISMPQILISDIGMPDEDGFDLIRSIRDGGCSAEQLPAIALSAFASGVDCKQALRAGFQAHLAKPTDAATLLQTIQDLLSGKSSEDRAKHRACELSSSDGNAKV